MSAGGIGSFLYSRVVDGLRYDVFERVADEAGPNALYNVLDADGNHLTEAILLTQPPVDDVIRLLVRRWKRARMVLIAPTDDGWRVVHVGSEVRVGLAALWWPL